MAYLGVHLTMHPTDSARHKWLYKAAFISCGLLMCSLIGIQTYRNNQAQDQLRAELDSIKKNTEQPPKVEITNNIPEQKLPPNAASPIGTLVRFDQIAPADREVPFMGGRPTRLNIFLVNAGPEPEAQDVSWDAKLVPMPFSSTPDREKREYEAFKKHLNLSSPADFALNYAQYHTFSSRTLSEDEAVAFAPNSPTRMTMYVFGYAAYRDSKGMHSVQWCQAVNSALGPMIQWHDCAGVPKQTR